LTPTLQESVKARIDRLANWAYGYHEFDVEFVNLLENEQWLVFGVLDSLCRELDGYNKAGGMESAICIAIRNEVSKDVVIREEIKTAMRDPEGDDRP
jgi:hypothetical protein